MNCTELAHKHKSSHQNNTNCRGFDTTLTVTNKNNNEGFHSDATTQRKTTGELKTAEEETKTKNLLGL